MTDKPYRLALIVGRFQMLHNGHRDMISLACRMSERVCILVGSSQEAGTQKNPLSYEERKEMLSRVFSDRVQVYPLPDAGLGNTAAWGRYVLWHVREHTGCLPDLIISGREGRRNGWFDEAQGFDFAELFIAKTHSISATQMREYLIRDDQQAWREHTAPELYDLYDKLREKVLAAQQNTTTASV